MYVVTLDFELPMEDHMARRRRTVKEVEEEILDEEEELEEEELEDEEDEEEELEDEDELEEEEEEDDSEEEDEDLDDDDLYAKDDYVEKRAQSRNGVAKEKPTSKKSRRRKSSFNRNAVANLEEIDWGDMVEKFAGASGDVMFLKAGKTRFRLLPPLKDGEITASDLFVPVDSVYRGNVSTKFLATVWATDSPIEHHVCTVLLSQKQVRQLLQLQMEDDYELYDLDEGHGISAIKTGERQQTSVNFLPSSKEVYVPDEVLENLEKFDVAAVADQFTKAQHERNSEDNEEDDKPKRRGKKRRSDDEDENDW